MRVLDLFSGIGGFSIGLERAGFETVAFCEIDPYCQKVLAKHWPDIPIHNDIKELNGDEYRGTIDVICGGYPCQPFSLAGNRDGAEDDRHLWPEVARLIREISPAYFIGENVTGHITMGLDEVLSDLEGLDYTTETFVIPACAVDAPHRRDRVWIIAHSNRDRLRNIEQQQGRNSKARPGHDGTKESLADTESRNDWTRDRGQVEGQGKKPRKSSFSDWRPWPSESGIRRTLDGVPDRSHRLRCLGNSVVPQIPEIIGHAILKKCTKLMHHNSNQKRAKE